MDSSSSLVPIDAAMLALMQGSLDPKGALQPFARQIMLIECQIAGTSFRDLTDVAPALVAGAVLPLKREPANPHDPLAIMILDEKGHHLGYVPRQQNEALAHLMDAGKLLFGILVKKEWRGKWLCVESRIIMRDL